MAADEPPIELRKLSRGDNNASNASAWRSTTSSGGRGSLDQNYNLATSVPEGDVLTLPFVQQADGESPLEPLYLAVPNPKITADHVQVPGELLLAQEEMTHARGADTYLSRIYRGGFHLNRLAPMKDMLVPTGPLSSFLGTVFNLANSTIGAGILGMGSAFRDMGLVLGALLLTVVPLLGALSTYLLLVSSQLSSARSMVVCAYRAFGKPGSVFVDLVTIISNFGALVAYFVLLGDFIPNVAYSLISPTSLLATERLLAMGLAAIIILPLALKPNVNDLRMASFLSMVFVMFVMVVVVVESAIVISDDGVAGDRLANGGLEAWLALPVVCFAFSNTSAVLPIFVEMQHPTIGNFMKVVVWASAFCWLMYELAGIISYITFGEALEGNMLNNFSLTEPAVVIARAAFAFTIISTYPLLMFPLRLSIEHMIFGTKRRFAHTEFTFCTLVVVGGSFGVAAITDNVELIFGLTGSLGSALMMFVIPGSLYLKVVGFGERNSASYALFVGAILLICIGITVAVLGIIGFAGFITDS